MLGMEGEACLDLFPQSITVALQLPKGKRGGKQGVTSEGHNRGNSLNQETGKERGGENKRKCAGGSADWERQMPSTPKLKNKSPKRHYF